MTKIRAKGRLCFRRGVPFPPSWGEAVSLPRRSGFARTRGGDEAGVEDETSGWAASGGPSGIDWDWAGRDFRCRKSTKVRDAFACASAAPSSRSGTTGSSGVGIEAGTGSGTGETGAGTGGTAGEAGVEASGAGDVTVGTGAAVDVDGIVCRSEMHTCIKPCKRLSTS